MRKLAQTSTALLLGSAGAAFAGGFADHVVAPEAGAYLRVSVPTGIRQALDFQYGLRLDYRTNIEALQNHRPVAEFNFDRAGFVNAWLNGLPVAQRLMLNQTEEGAPAGDGMTYTSVDWAMIGIGALGVGFAAAEMGSVEESPDRAATPATPPAAPPGPPGVPGVPPLPPLPPNPLPMCTPPNPLLPPICQPGMSEDYQNPILKAYTVTTPDHQAWLDSGMGQMGDLVLIK